MSARDITFHKSIVISSSILMQVSMQHLPNFNRFMIHQYIENLVSYFINQSPCFCLPTCNITCFSNKKTSNWNFYPLLLHLAR